MLKKNMKTLLLLSILSASSLLASDSSKFEEGREVFGKWCVHCHGKNMPASDALGIVYKGTGIPAVLEDRKDLDPGFIKYVVRHGRFSMPFFRKVEISEEQLDSLAFYLSTKNK